MATTTSTTSTPLPPPSSSPPSPPAATLPSTSTSVGLTSTSQSQSQSVDKENEISIRIITDEENRVQSTVSDSESESESELVSVSGGISVRHHNHNHNHNRNCDDRTQRSHRTLNLHAQVSLTRKGSFCHSQASSGGSLSTTGSQYEHGSTAAFSGFSGLSFGSTSSVSVAVSHLTKLVGPRRYEAPIHPISLKFVEKTEEDQITGAMTKTPQQLEKRYLRDSFLPGFAVRVIVFLILKGAVQLLVQIASIPSMGFTFWIRSRVSQLCLWVPLGTGLIATLVIGLVFVLRWGFVRVRHGESKGLLDLFPPVVTIILFQLAFFGWNVGMSVINVAVRYDVSRILAEEKLGLVFATLVVKFPFANLLVIFAVALPLHISTAIVSYVLVDGASLFTLLLSIILGVVISVAMLFVRYFSESKTRSAWFKELVLKEKNEHLVARVALTSDLIRNVLPSPFLDKIEFGTKIEPTKTDSACPVVPRNDWIRTPLLYDEHFETICFLQSDIVGFTAYCHSERGLSKNVLMVLNQIYTAFDNFALDSGVHKLTTLGDAWLAIMNPFNHDHTSSCVALGQFALGFLQILEDLNEENGWSFRLRVGLACGSGRIAVIGRKRLTMEVFGPVSREADQLEQSSMPGRVLVNEAFRSFVEKSDQVSFGFESSEFPERSFVVPACDERVSFPKENLPDACCEYDSKKIDLLDLELPKKAILVHALFGCFLKECGRNLKYMSFALLSVWEKLVLSTAVSLMMMICLLSILIGFSGFLEFDNILMSWRIVAVLGGLAVAHSVCSVCVYLRLSVSLGIVCLLQSVLVLLFLFLLPSLSPQAWMSLKSTAMIWSLVVIAFLPVVPVAIVLALLITVPVVQYFAYTRLHSDFVSSLDSLSLIGLKFDVVYGVGLSMFIITGVFMERWVTSWSFFGHHALDDRLESIKIEEKRNRRLLLSVLPSRIVRLMEHTESPLERRHLLSTVFLQSTVCFLDLHFDKCILLSTGLLRFLNSYFSYLDSHVARSGCEKVKSISHKYMFYATGRMTSSSASINSVITFASTAMRTARYRLIEAGSSEGFEDRESLLSASVSAGLCHGQVFAGIIGSSTFLWDLVSDTVNTASRMGCLAPEWGVQFPMETGSVWVEEDESRASFLTDAGSIQVKGKGQMSVFHLDWSSFLS